MNEFRLRRGLAGGGGYLSVGQGEQRNPSEGRQGKSTDQSRVHVVGWIEHFGHWLLAPGWRLNPKYQGFQHLKRHRLPSQGGICP